MPDPHRSLLADDGEPRPVGTEDRRVDVAQGTALAKATRGNIPDLNHPVLDDPGSQSAPGRAEPDSPEVGSREGQLLSLACQIGVERQCGFAVARPDIPKLCRRSSVLRGFEGVLGGVQALVLVTFNGTVPVWEGLVILAAMFLGTAVYRAENGQSTWRYTAGTAVLVVACVVGSAHRYGDGDHFTRRGWIIAFLLAVLTFGAGLASRRRRLPRTLTGLGTISYSVYMVHPVLLAVIDSTIGRRRQDNLVLEVAFVTVLLPLCVLTYRCIEAPSQTWGRRLAHRVQPP